jgi:biotin carboxyl carrier protein
MIRRYSITVAGRARDVEVEELDGGQWRVSVDGRERRLDVRWPAAGMVGWLDGSGVVQASVDGALPRPTVGLRRQSVPVEVVDGRLAALAGVVKDRARAAGPTTVRAPIPGRVARLLVKVGEAVTAGKGMVVLEAMKMENELRAPRDGVVKELGCAEGAAVESGQALVTLE